MRRQEVRQHKQRSAEDIHSIPLVGGGGSPGGKARALLEEGTQDKLERCPMEAGSSAAEHLQTSRIEIAGLERGWRPRLHQLSAHGWASQGRH